MTGKRAVAQRPPKSDRNGKPAGGRIALAVFFVCFTLFTLNVLLGKLSIMLGWEGVPLLGDVPEFLLLLLSVTIFVAAFLQREAAERNGGDSNQTENRED